MMIYLPCEALCEERLSPVMCSECRRVSALPGKHRWHHCLGAYSTECDCDCRADLMPRIQIDRKTHTPTHRSR